MQHSARLRNVDLRKIIELELFRVASHRHRFVSATIVEQSHRIPRHLYRKMRPLVDQAISLEGCNVFG